MGDGSNDRKVFVGGLPQNVDEAAVRGLFHEKGQVERVTLPHAHFTTSMTTSFTTSFPSSDML